MAAMPLSVGLGSFETFLLQWIRRGRGEHVHAVGRVRLDKIKKWGKSRNWCPYCVPDPQGHQPPGSTIVGYDNDGRDGLRWGL